MHMIAHVAMNDVVCLGCGEDIDGIPGNRRSLSAILTGKKVKQVEQSP